DADNFSVDLSNIADARLKALAFAAVVLIDVVHFENAK
ncbi:MAG: scramblase, partial [Polyangiaceae bacterium]|nr:scramblase [Polyangiaceae bacterium]